MFSVFNALFLFCIVVLCNDWLINQGRTRGEVGRPQTS